MERLEGQASHLVRFLATGGDSPAVRAELRAIETTFAGLREERETIEKGSVLPAPRVHPAWVMTKLQRLDAGFCAIRARVGLALEPARSPDWSRLRVARPRPLALSIIPLSLLGILPVVGDLSKL